MGKQMETITTDRVKEIDVPIKDTFLDFFRRDSQMVVEWKSPNYSQTNILWGLFKYERGEIKIFTIKGKPGFIQAVLRDLNNKGTFSTLSGSA